MKWSAATIATGHAIHQRYDDERFVREFFLVPQNIVADSERGIGRSNFRGISSGSRRRASTARAFISLPSSPAMSSNCRNICVPPSETELLGFTHGWAG